MISILLPPRQRLERIDFLTGADDALVYLLEAVQGDKIAADN